MYGNGYFGQPRYSQMNMTMPNQQMPTQNYIPPMTQSITPVGLLGKVVESVDVVKAMDIPLDGSVSYFPLSDGTAIVSKQLQNDGTSKITIYKPSEEDKKDAIRFATFEDIQEAIDGLDLSDIQDLKDDIKEIKKQLKEIRAKKGKDE